MARGGGAAVSGLRSIKRGAERRLFAPQIPKHRIMQNGLPVGTVASETKAMNRTERRQVMNGLMRKMLAGERPS